MYFEFSETSMTGDRKHKHLGQAEPGWRRALSRPRQRQTAAVVVAAVVTRALR